jgi:hypothetical protein
MSLAVLLAAGVACEPRESLPSSAADAKRSEKRTKENKESKPAKGPEKGAAEKPDGESPEHGGWAEMPKPSASAAKPVAMIASSKPRFVIFSASWCPGCEASVLEDAALAKRFRGKVEVGVALKESDADFVASSMSKWLGEMPVWTQKSTKAVRQACRVSSIPAACLVKGGQVLWRGGPGDGMAVLQGYLDGKLDETKARYERGRAAAKQALDDTTPDTLTRAADTLRGFASRENSIAWDLVDKDEPSKRELELGVTLARDAVDASAGLNFAILDTFALVLWKSGNKVEAARVGKRVLEVCDALGSHCGEERKRAEDFIAATASM